MHKHVHSETTYPLRVYQFTSQQLVKEVKKEQFFTHNSKSYLEYANMFIQSNLPPESEPVHSTASE